MYWEKLDGFFSFQPFYEKIINQLDGEIFVELGVWKGRSIMYMAERAKELNKNVIIHGVDVFEVGDQQQHCAKFGTDFYGEVINNIEPMKDIITLHKMSSHDAYKLFEDESIDFLFIDAHHTYEDVKKELELWYPKVKTGGIISGHDYIWIGAVIKKAVDEFFTVERVTPEEGDSWSVIK